MAAHRSIHAMCEEPAEAPDGTPLSCMKPYGHTINHRDVSEGYIWFDGTTPVEEV